MNKETLKISCTFMFILVFGLGYLVKTLLYTDDDVPSSTIIFLMIITTSEWVLIDAHRMGVKKGWTTGIFNMSPIWWGILCLYIWIIIFPAYLIKRPLFKSISQKYR